MATRPALRQRKASPAAAARSLPQQQPQSGSPTSTTTTTTSLSRFTPDLSLDGPASMPFAGLDEDPVPNENVTVTVRFRPRSDSNNDDRRGQVTEAGDVEGKLPDEEAAVDPQSQGAASSGSRKFEDVLAAWMRLKYPHIAVGALASSAPILQF